MKNTIRTYKSDDFDILHAIDQACYEASIAYSKWELRAYLRLPNAECIVAETKNEIVGFCVTTSHATRGYIVTMDVLEPFRRDGVGSALLAEAERKLEQNGVREIGLETATGNESAIAFWQKHGYRTHGVKKNYYPGGRDAFAMAKTIPSAAKTSRKDS